MCNTTLNNFFFFSSRRRHTRCSRDWSSDVCSSDLGNVGSVAADLMAKDGAIIVAVSDKSGAVHNPRGLDIPDMLKWVKEQDRKSTRLNSSHGYISYAVFCLKKKKKILKLYDV